MRRWLSEKELQILTACPQNVQDWYGRVSEHHDKPMPEYEPNYGCWPGGDPRQFCPDLECNQPEELARWAEACQRAELGENPQHVPSYPDHPYGCTRDEQFGLGSYWRRLTPAEQAEFAASWEHDDAG